MAAVVMTEVLADERGTPLGLRNQVAWVFLISSLLPRRLQGGQPFSLVLIAKLTFFDARDEALERIEPGPNTKERHVEKKVADVILDVLCWRCDRHHRLDNGPHSLVVLQWTK